MFHFIFKDKYGEGYPVLGRNTDESYTLELVSGPYTKTGLRCLFQLALKASVFTDSENDVRVTISAPTYFGAKHAVDTLFQLIQFDDVNERFLVVTAAQIEDAPEFPHRGLMLDTSRNFIKVNTIKRIMDGMAHAKV